MQFCVPLHLGHTEEKKSLTIITNGGIGRANNIAMAIKKGISLIFFMVSLHLTDYWENRPFGQENLLAVKQFSYIRFSGKWLEINSFWSCTFLALYINEGSCTRRSAFFISNATVIFEQLFISSEVHFPDDTF